MRPGAWSSLNLPHVGNRGPTTFAITWLQEAGIPAYQYGPRAFSAASLPLCLLPASGMFLLCGWLMPRMPYTPFHACEPEPERTLSDPRYCPWPPEETATWVRVGCPLRVHRILKPVHVSFSLCQNVSLLLFLLLICSDSQNHAYLLPRTGNAEVGYYTATRKTPLTPS